MLTLFLTNRPDAPPVPVAAGQTLLAALHTAALDHAHACGGRGRCTTCRLEISSGADALLPATPAETRFRALGRLPATSRLACQAAARPATDDVPPGAELRATVPPEGQLPQLSYT